MPRCTGTCHRPTLHRSYSSLHHSKGDYETLRNTFHNIMIHSRPNHTLCSSQLPVCMFYVLLAAAITRPSSLASEGRPTDFVVKQVLASKGNYFIKFSVPFLLQTQTWTVLDKPCPPESKLVIHKLHLLYRHVPGHLTANKPRWSKYWWLASASHQKQNLLWCI